MASTVWRGYITFGLISIPVRLFRAARAERVSLRQVSRTPKKEEKTGWSGPNATATLVRAPERSLKRVDFAPEPEAYVEPLIEPVRQKLVSQTTGQVLDKQALAKAYEYEKAHYVVVEPDELKV